MLSFMTFFLTVLPLSLANKVHPGFIEKQVEISSYSSGSHLTSQRKDLVQIRGIFSAC